MTDFACHTRNDCNICLNLECRCRICKGDLENPCCKRGSKEFPMSANCNWNTILVCSFFIKGEEGHD